MGFDVVSWWVFLFFRGIGLSLLKVWCVVLASFHDLRILCSVVDILGVVFAVCFCFAVLPFVGFCTCM